MKRISSLFLHIHLRSVLMPINYSRKEQKTEKQTGNQSTSVEKISDNIL
ncbi:RNase A-like domain-containing lipoprotein, partial [Bacillus sp. B-TM1]